MDNWLVPLYLLSPDQYLSLEGGPEGSRLIFFKGKILVLAHVLFRGCNPSFIWLEHPYFPFWVLIFPGTCANLISLPILALQMSMITQVYAYSGVPGATATQKIASDSYRTVWSWSHGCRSSSFFPLPFLPSWGGSQVGWPGCPVPVMPLNDNVPCLFCIWMYTCHLGAIACV